MRPLTLACALLLCGQAQAASLQDSLSTVAATNQQAAESNKRIDDLNRQTQSMLEEYRQLQAAADSAETDDGQAQALQSLKQKQEQEIAHLHQRIAAIQQAQTRIAPMMARMAEALQKFVELDLPFQREERLARIAKLQERLRDPDTTQQDRMRSLLEAWQVELDYGRSVEAWRGPLTSASDKRSVDYLRVGRTALYYQTLDGSESGLWDPAKQQWVPLPADYNRPLRESLKVAQKHSAPALLELPLRASAVSTGGNAS